MVCLTVPSTQIDIPRFGSNRPLVFPLGNLEGSLNESVREGVLLLDDVNGNVRSTVLAILVVSWPHLKWLKWEPFSQYSQIQFLIMSVEKVAN